MKFIETLSQIIKHQPKPQPSWATHLVIALSFVIIGAGYLAYNTYLVKSVKAADEISIISPDVDDTWFISDITGTIEWIVTTDGSPIQIDYFKIDYSYYDSDIDNWGDWLEIDHHVPGGRSSYEWSIADMALGEYLIKIGAYKDGVIAPIIEAIMSGSFTITDVQTISDTVKFIADTSSVNENTGTHSVEVVYTVAIGGTTLPDVIVIYQVSDITTSPDDYTDQGTGTLIFPGGISGSQMIIFDINPDDILEDNETFQIELSSVENATIGEPSIHIVTIIDVLQLEGTYYSPEYPIYDGAATAHILSLDGFDALASLSDFNSQVEFAIKLIDTDGNYLGPDEFVSLNYNESASELAAKFSGLDLSLVDKVQFRICMQTADNTYYPPWVESLNFRYTVETDESIKMGDIVFVGDNHKSVERGNQINYEVMLTPIDEFKDILTVVLNMATSANGITADPVTINFDGSDNYIATITLTTTNEAPVANDIPFYIRTIATDPDRPDLYTEPNPLEGKIDITDGSVIINDFSLFLIEDYKNPAPGGLVIFTVNITKNDGFNEDINFTTDIETQLTGIVDPAGTYFDPTGAIPPTESAVNLHVKILDIIDPANLDQEFSFTIIGASVDSQITHSVIGYITVSESDNSYLAITLNLTAPVEGGVSDNLSYPSFIFRLYAENETNPDTYTIQADNLTADDYDSNTKTASIQVNIEEGYVADTSTYIGYLRSTRHLWRKATIPFEGKITIDADNLTYTMSFPELIAGDIAPASRDNIINSIDYTRLTQDFWSTIIGLLPDFNNDNVINSLDVSFLFGNWWKESELP